MNEYLSYPDGYEKLCHDLLPLPLRPFKKMLMPLFLKILNGSIEVHNFGDFTIKY